MKRLRNTWTRGLKRTVTTARRVLRFRDSALQRRVTELERVTSRMSCELFAQDLTLTLLRVTRSDLRALSTPRTPGDRTAGEEAGSNTPEGKLSLH